MEEQKHVLQLASGNASAPPANAITIQQSPDEPRTAASTIATPQQRLKTACSSCRQQKIKCRTTDELTTPCERCARMGLTCTFEPRNSRARPRSDSDVGGANDSTPKRRLVARDGENGFNTFTAVNTSAGELADQDASKNGEQSSGLPRLPYAPGLETILAARQTTNGTVKKPAIARMVANDPQETYEVETNYKSPMQTVSRSVESLRFSAETIDNLFALFKKHYYPFIPVIETEKIWRPNECYTRSPFLFWSILAVASRRGPENTALTSALRMKVLKRASTAVTAQNVGLGSIIATLMILNWTFPESSAQDDMPYVLSSALLHAALRIGLNNIDASVLAADRGRRYDLYMHCSMLYHRSACCMGLSAGIVSSAPTSSYRNNLHPTYVLQHDLARILTSTTQAIISNGLDLTSRASLDNFQGILEEAEANINAGKPQLHGAGSLGQYYFTLTHLQLQALQFLKPLANTHIHAWRSPFDLACEIIHQLHDLEKSLHIDLYGISYVYNGVLLAACTLFRCLKTPFADSIGRDASTAQALFYSAINMLRNISLVEGDKPSRSAWALQQLWRSEKIYRKTDGEWDLDLHVRDRFGSSVVYDIMWWSRAEFNGQSNAYSYAQTPNDPITIDDGIEPDALADETHRADWFPMSGR